ncbi:hypothetical protein CDIK_2220 [Cucumispora dikerogammari]|nr:hypothetical protein CDIK_2220 [Cucumispora dikerogammari]
MFALVFNLSIISCDKEVDGEEWLDTKILNCVDKNGSFIELPFNSNFCTYKLTFCQKEWKCSLIIDLKINKKRNINMLSLDGRLVRCTENIGINSFDQDYKIGQNSSDLRNFFDYNRYGSNENGFEFYIFEVFTEIFQQVRKYHKKCVDYRVGCFCLGKRIKSKPITQSRKALGIKGDKIKTTVFKLILFLTFGNRRNQTGDIKMIVETLPFSFNENEGGTLVIESGVKIQRCMKS